MQTKIEFVCVSSLLVALDGLGACNDGGLQ